MTMRSVVSGKVYRYPKISINMTDRDIIDRVAEIFGVKTYDIPNARKNDRKDQFRATLCGAKAASLMNLLYSIMGYRRQAKIDEILNEYRQLESTEIRRQRNCSIAQQARRRNERGQFLGG